jgi:bifunctional polynucleotide phosphatase/kinase
VRSVHARGHAVVIFSNQGGVKGALDGKRADVVRRRVDALARDLGVPVHFFCGTQKGAEKDPFGYRKPRTGAWRHFETKCNGGVSIDLETSYYVGDAAGRPGDHSDSDAAFARNVGVRFFTPEAFFAERGFENVLGRKAPPNEPTPREEDEAVVALDVTDDAFDRENTP